MKLAKLWKIKINYDDIIFFKRDGNSFATFLNESLFGLKQEIEGILKSCRYSKFIKKL